ncbi:tetratricopeptide repeat protein [bacterium BD-1]|nr:tetratricopeptide repeat protein [Ottowia caeni]
MHRALLALLLMAAAAAPVSAASVAEAEALLKARDPRAAAVVATLLAATPRDVQARVLHTQLLLQQRKAEDALEFAEDTVEIAPRSALAHYWLGRAYGSRIGQVGMLSKMSMAPKLRASFERAVELDPNLHGARSALVEFHLQAPSIVGGSVEEARRQANELLRRDPPRGHYALASVLASEGKEEAARKAYLAAHAARPGQAEYRMAAGIAHQQAGDWDQSFAIFEAWTREDPKAAGAWYQLGRASALSGQRLETGADALRRYLALPASPGEPEPKHAWYRLGQVLAQAGDKAGARTAFQQALKADPKFAEPKAELARL